VIVKPDPIPEFPEPEDQAPPVVFVKAVPVIITAFELSDAYPAAISTTVLGLVPSLDKVNPFIYPFTSLEPPPDGVDHVPSPRQKVDDDALVPLFKFPTGKLPVTPVDKGKPVAFVRITEFGVPSVGVTKVGEVASTIVPPLPVTVHPDNAVPLPCRQGDVTVVESVIAGVVVAFATVPAMPFAETTDTVLTEPEPDGVDHVPSPRQKVDEEADEPLLRFPTAKFPVTPVESGNPVAFVKTTLAGVPNAGVVSVGDVRVLFVRVCVSVVPTIVPAGAVREVPQADPVDTTIPAPGYV
jgi:hypothetical protein